MKKRIKAQSGLITVVLIILLVLAGIIVVWNVVYGLIKKSSEDVKIDSFQNTIEVKEAALNPNGLYSIKVSKDSGNKTIDSLKINLEYEDGTQETMTETNSSNIPKSLETRELKYVTKKPVKKVSVTPIFKNKAGLTSDGTVIDKSGNLDSLFLNPSFENGLNNWGAYTWDSPSTTLLNVIADPSAPNGNNVVNISCNNVAANRPCGIAQGGYIFNANINYTVQWRIKCPVGRTIVLYASNRITWLDISNPLCNGNWQTYITRTSMGTQQSDSIFLGDFGGGTFSYQVDSAIFREGN